MSRKTRKRLAELQVFPNAWSAETLRARGGLAACFAAAKPLVLELGCGRGEYTVALARRRPQYNFAGVDVKGARLHRGAEAALQAGLSNVAFLHMPVDALPDVMGPLAARDVWLLFPDPFPKPSKANRRLTSPRYLAVYRRLLEPDARIHLKTDHPGLYAYTLEVLRREGGIIRDCHDPLTARPDSRDPLYLQTSYERRWRAEGRIIRYVSFSLTPVTVTSPAP